MTSPIATRTFCPVLTSAGPRAGTIACAFEGARRSLSLVRVPQNHEATAPKHAGQRALDALFERAHVASTLHVHHDLSPEEAQDPRWQIPLAVHTLIAIRNHISGLAEHLYREDIFALLEHIKLTQTAHDAHRIHAALYGGFHTQITPQGDVVQFNTPEAAMIWLQIPAQVPKSAWTETQNSTLSYKKHTGTSERTARWMLQALCHEDFAILDAFNALQPPQTLLRTIPGWIPAQRTLKDVQPRTLFALEGRGPDALIFARSEQEALDAATLVQERLEAHSFRATLHAWSTIQETS